MKVLHITANYPTTEHPVFGIFVKEQVESLRNEGVDCDVFFSNGKENGGMKEHRASIKKVRHMLRENNYDVIHCHHSISGLILFLAGGTFRNKCIVSYQNDPTREFGGMRLFHLLYAAFDKVIIKNTTELLKKKKVVYLPNGTNADFFKPMDKEACKKKLGWNTDKHYILYMDSNVGTRTQKRHDRYEKVLELLKKDFDNIVSIELTNTPREEIPTYMNACDLHLMTSDFEGSPNSVKECMCCNTPVVCTPVGNVPDMMGDIPGCYVTKGFSSKELAACVKKVLTSEELFNIRNLFLAKGYGIETVAKKLKGLYEELAVSS
jgi:glycosyltransferase involved in cell wall biosynthesis